MIRRPAKYDILSTRRRDNTNGFAGWWLFSDGTAMDWSGHQQNGILNGTINQVTGIAGRALTFDGSTSYINYGNVNVFSASQAWTIVAWIKHSMTGTCNIITKQLNGGSFAGWGLGLNGSGAYEIFLYGSGACITDAVANNNDGLWHRVVATYDGSNNTAGMRLCIDGFSKGLSSIGNTGANPSSSADFQISGRGGAANLFTGSIGDARLYTRVWSAAEANTDYNKAIAAANQPEGELPMLFYPVSGPAFNPAWAAQANWLNGMRAGT